MPSPERSGKRACHPDVQGCQEARILKLRAFVRTRGVFVRGSSFPRPYHLSEHRLSLRIRLTHLLSHLGPGITPSDSPPLLLSDDRQSVRMTPEAHK